jgi:L-threonylcarbamoyladenylate synthase
MLIPSNEAGMSQSTDAIQRGDLVAFPTDTFFALGANGLDANAVDAVFTTKGRNPGTPVPLLINDVEMADELSNHFPKPLRELAGEFWPGALTVVLPASNAVPEVVTAGSGTVGLRVPDNEVARELIDRSGVPITGTSCNLTGREPIKEAAVVDQVFNDQISFCIDSPCGDSTAPSTVIKYEKNQIVVLRLGDISVGSLQKIVGNIVVN